MRVLKIFVAIALPFAPLYLIAKPSLVSWNISSLQQESLVGDSSVYGNARTFIELPSQELDFSYIVITGSKELLLQKGKKPQELAWGSCIDLQSFNSGKGLAALREGGRDMIISTSDDPVKFSTVRIPVYCPLKAFSLYQRPIDGRLFLLGLNTLGSAVTQFEVTKDWKELIPVRTIDLKNESFDQGQLIVCNEEYGRLYVVGSAGCLICFDADPNGSVQKLEVLNAGKMSPSEFVLFKVQQTGQQGSIVLIEKKSMTAKIWKQNQLTVEPNRVLAVIGSPVPKIVRQLSPSLNRTQSPLAALDRLGNVHYFSSEDFLISD